jgi:hypothetical protein
MKSGGDAPTTRSTKLTILSLAAWAIAFQPTNILANPLPLSDSGILTVTSQGNLLDWTTTPACFNWGGGTGCAGATHNMAVTGATNLFSAPATGAIRDFSSFPPPTLVAFEAVNGAGSLAGDIINFDMTGTMISPFGDCTSNAAGNSCSPANSPFTLSEDGVGGPGSDVTIKFTVFLNAYTCPGGVTGTTGGCNSSNTLFTPYKAQFKFDVNGTMTGAGACSGVAADITNILNCENATGPFAGMTPGTITVDGWSATESPVTAPEPAGFALFGSGLIGVFLFGRRFRRS